MTTEQLLTWAVLVLIGFTACAEFGSYAFVHPVIRRLPLEHHVAVEQGLVRTFGRVMPFLMTGSMILLVMWASASGFDRPVLHAVALALWAAGLTTSILVNVGINRRTAAGAHSGDPVRWRGMRERWEFFQAFRSWAFVLAFAGVAAVVATGPGS